MPGIHKSGNRSYRQKWSHPEKIQVWWKVKEENRDLLVEDLRSRSNLKGLFTKYFYLSNLAETSFPQIVLFCFIYMCICLSVYFVFVFIYLSCYSGLGEWWDIGRVALHCPLHRWSFLRPGRGDRILHSPQQQSPEKEHSFLASPILFPQGAWNHFHVPLIWDMA